MTENRPAAAGLTEIEDPWLFFEDVCEIHRIQPRTMRYLRVIGQGPQFIKVGRRLRIRESQAKAWFAEKYESASS